MLDDHGRIEQERRSLGKRLAARGEEWFWHVLALALGGRTIAEWQAVMTEPEAQAWVEFYRLFPFDDLHRYHRPAALMRSGLAGKFEDALEFLQPEPANVGLIASDVSIMRTLGFARKGG